MTGLNSSQMALCSTQAHYGHFIGPNNIELPKTKTLRLKLGGNGRFNLPKLKLPRSRRPRPAYHNRLNNIL
jgi:hypothetical protein